MARKKKSDTSNGDLQNVPVEDVVVQTKVIPQTKEELLRQEEIVQRGTVESIRALRTIRQEKLHQFAPGHNEWNTSFDAYVEERWQRTRQWATQEIQWLEVCEHVEQRFGKSIYHFRHSHTRALRKLIPHPDVFSAALDEMKGFLKSDQEKERIRDVVNRRVAYIKMMEEWDEMCRKLPGLRDLPALQFKEYIALHLLEGGSTQTLWTAKKKAAESGRPLKDCVIEDCRASKSLPGWRYLLEEFRCEQLEELCLELLALKTEWQYAVDAKEAAKKKQDEARLMIAKFRPEPPETPTGPRIIHVARPVEDYTKDELDHVTEAIGKLMETQYEPLKQDFFELQADGQDVSDHPFVHLVILYNFANNTQDKLEDHLGTGPQHATA